MAEIYFKKLRDSMRRDRTKQTNSRTEDWLVLSPSRQFKVTILSDENDGIQPTRHDTQDKVDKRFQHQDNCFYHQEDSGGPLVRFEKLQQRGKIVKKVFLIGN